MKRTVLFALTLAALMLTACSGGEGGDPQSHQDYLAVRLEERGAWSFVDREGNVVAENAYPAEAKISDVYDGAYWVVQEGKFRLYNVSAPTEQLGEAYDAATDFAAGYAVATVSGQPICIVNTKGKVSQQLPTEITHVTAFNPEGVARFTKSDGKQGLLNTSGKILFEADVDFSQYQAAEGAIIGHDAVNGSYAVYDYKGNSLWTITPDLGVSGVVAREAYYSDGLLPLRSHRENGGDSLLVFNKNGERQFAVYAALLDGGFRDGYTLVSIVGGYNQIVNAKGETTYQTTEYGNRLFNLGNGRFLLAKGSPSGCDIIDAQGNVVTPNLPPFVDATYPQFGNRLLLNTDGAIHVFTSDGQMLGERGFKEMAQSPCVAAVDYADFSQLGEYVVKEMEAVTTVLPLLPLMEQARVNPKMGSYRRGFAIDTTVCNLPLSRKYGFDRPLTVSVPGGYVWNDARHTSYILSFTLSDIDRTGITDGQPAADLIVEKLKGAGYKEVKPGTLYKEAQDPKADAGVTLKKTVTVSVGEGTRRTFLSVNCQIESNEPDVSDYDEFQPDPE